MNTDYNFWRDLLDTYQSLTPWVQALWLVGPLGFILALLKLPKPVRKASQPMQSAPHSPPPPLVGQQVYEVDLLAEEIEMARLEAWVEDQRKN